MPKIIGLGFLIVLIGAFVVSWPELTGSRADVKQSSTRQRTASLFLQEIESRTDITSLPSEQIHDMTFVFSDGD